MIEESNKKKNNYLFILENKELHTVSGFNAPDDSTLKKYLLGTFVGSNGASCLSSGNSKIS